MIRSGCGKRAASDEPRSGGIEKLHPALRVAAVIALLVLAGCKKRAWTPVGGAEIVLAEIKLRGVAAVARRLDTDESFGRSVMSGIATGDSVWLEVASKLRPASAAAQASLSMALASALPHSPRRVLGILGYNYPVAEVCAIPFMRPDSSLIVSYYADAAAALGRVRDSSLTQKRDVCMAALDTARDDKLARIDPAYLVKNKPVSASRARRSGR